MAETQGDEDKQYEPSQKKLEDARKKGEVPKSIDLTTAAAYGGLLAAAVALGPASLIGLGTALQVLLDQSDNLAQVAFSGSTTPLMGGMIRQTLIWLAPWFALPAVFAILSVIAQRAFLVTPSKLLPKLSRISPIQGAKNKFGRNGLFEFAKSFVKLLLYSVLLGVYLVARRDQMIGAMFMSPGMIAVTLLEMVMVLLLIVLLIAVSIGAIDFLWQRAEHLRKNRMSRKEMTDEIKQSEGDPVMKQQRRQKGVDIAMNKMLTDVPTADVVVVNPTHYAVALKWTRLPGTAPVCVAKGTDGTAARIRELAQEHGVPIHSDPPTARALHASVEIGAQILPEHFRAVAAAIRFAERIRKKMRGRS